MLSLLSLFVRDFLLSKYFSHTCLWKYYDSLQHSTWTSWHRQVFFAGHKGGFVQLGLACQFLTIQFTFKCSGYCTVMDFLEHAVSILDLSVLVLAGKFCSKCHPGNSSFHHLLKHDLFLLVVSLWSFLLTSIVQWYFLPLNGSLR